MEEIQGEGEGRRRNYWGNEPETEEEYYALQSIRGTQSIFTSPSSGRSLFTRSWLPSTTDATTGGGLVLMVHGYGNDISWTFQATPIFLARHGFSCFALDLPGHGRSDGLKAFVPDLNSVIDDCISYFNSVILAHYQQPCFLYGESMGGAICLLIHLRSNASLQQRVSGAVLVAPMCKISENIKPPWPLPQILTAAARFFPTLPIVPTTDLVDKSVKVEEKRVVASSNPMRYNGRPRLGTVLELMRVTNDLGTRLSDVTIPFIVLHGSADTVTDPEVSRELYRRSKSNDKTIKMYPGMMHSLLFGEMDDNVDRVRRDILAWLESRCDAS